MVPTRLPPGVRRELSAPLSTAERRFIRELQGKDPSVSPSAQERWSDSEAVRYFQQCQLRDQELQDRIATERADRRAAAQEESPSADLAGNPGSVQAGTPSSMHLSGQV